eukprot:10912658-Karenia_brevis.AAC.1
MKSALVSSKVLRLASRAGAILMQSLGGGCHPPEGLVAGQTILCSSVPTADRQSWHRLVSVQPLTLASRACGHCPPHRADMRYARKVGSHLSKEGHFQVDFALGSKSWPSISL